MTKLETILKIVRIVDNKSRFFILLIFKLFIVMLENHVFLFETKQIIDYFENSRFDFLIKIFFMITSRMLIDIQHRKFNVKKIFKFFVEFVAIDFKNVLKMKTITQLLRFFEMFCQIVCALISKKKQQFLQLTMSFYRMKLMKLIVVNFHVFILNYHNEFVARLIRINLDDFEFWRQSYQNVEWKLQSLHARQQFSKQIVARTIDIWIFEYNQTFTKSLKSLSIKNSNLFWNFKNEDCVQYNQITNCTIKNCRFQHVCFICQNFAHDMIFCFKRTTRRWLIDSSFFFFLFQQVSDVVFHTLNNWEFLVRFLSRRRVKFERFKIFDDWTMKETFN